MILLTYWKSNNLEDGENWKDKKEHIYYKSLFGRLRLKYLLIYGGGVSSVPLQVGFQ